MKTGLIISLLLLASCDQGAMFVTPDLAPDQVHRLESQGVDLRVYEFTPITAPDKQCIFVSGTSKGALECFDKLDIDPS